MLTATDYKKKKTRCRLAKNRAYKRRIRSLYNGSASDAIVPVSKTGQQNPENPLDITYYKRRQTNHCKTSAKKYFKNYSNRVIRRRCDETFTGCNYKKLVEVH